ncbi:hypothetical protein CEXT_553141 [Caerostris extrusa]|uniref:Uncharacterized protein n=1 Tax=Caerostris extrusa TaxID=172846 RepID=A0AAV4XGN5_CAEEX|nr:hypothetical protein CEXT_553141 [Caerostris extrusa]
MFESSFLVRNRKVYLTWSGLGFYILPLNNEKNGPISNSFLKVKPLHLGKILRNLHHHPRVWFAPSTGNNLVIITLWRWAALGSPSYSHFAIIVEKEKKGSFNIAFSQKTKSLIVDRVAFPRDPDFGSEIYLLLPQSKTLGCRLHSSYKHRDEQRRIHCSHCNNHHSRDIVQQRTPPKPPKQGLRTVK